MRSLLFVCLYAACASSVSASTLQYSPRQDIATGFNRLYGIAVADFNGDGKPDIAVTDDDDKRIVVYLNNGNGSFSAPISTTLQIGANGIGPIVAGDFNEDGKQDFIVGTIAGLQADILVTGNGDGTFTQQQALPGSFGFFGASVVDINHDSHLDLIAGGNGSLYVYLGDGRGNFVEQPFSNQGPRDTFLAIAAADFNLDGKTDFIATAFSANNLRYFPGNGDGTFAAPTIFGAGITFSPQSLVTADFNGDSKPDLLVGSANIASIFLGGGDGTFNTSQVRTLPIPQGPQTQTSSPPAVAAADMNGDGKVDAVTVDSFSNTLNVFLNDGTGKFPQSVPDFTAALPAGSSEIRLADLNGDGLPDIIVTNYITENISIFLSIRPPTAPSIALTSSATAQLVGTPLTLTTRITGVSNLIATGAVTLLDGSTSLGQQTLNPTGQAIFSVSNLAAGSHALSISYAGDKDYLPAMGGSVTESVTDFQLALASPSQTVASGAAATYSLNLTPVAAFAGTVTFTCSGLPAGAACATTTAMVAGQPVTTSLNVSTVKTNAVRADARPSHIMKVVGVSLASLLLIAFLPGRRRLPQLAALLITFGCLGALAGCSGGSLASTPAPPVTTAFTITGSTSQAGVTITHQVAATLIVN